MTHDDNTALLLDELRRDTELDDERELDSLARVRERLAVRLVSSDRADEVRPDEARLRVGVLRSRRRLGARAGTLAALLVGTALGAGGHAVVSFAVAPETASPRAASALKKGPLRSQRTPAVVPVLSPSSTGATAASLPPPAALPELQRAPRPVASAQLGFDIELRELEAARREVTAAPGSALRALENHAQQYPSSLLSQEREALRVRALVGAGRYVEARASAGQFRSRYPDSMLLGAVDRAIASIP